MKIFKKFLKYWITLSSVTGFLLGWLFVSQFSEAKFANGTTPTSAPIQPIATALPPIPSLDALVGGSQQQNIQVQQFTVMQPPALLFQPQLRTGGS